MGLTINRWTAEPMPNPADDAMSRARAELRAVQEAAVMLAVATARFAKDAEHLAGLLRELDAQANG
jgi:hypothetical protein